MRFLINALTMTFPGEGTGVLLVAFEESVHTILGTVVVKTSPQSKAQAEFARLYVDAGARQKGIGRALLEEACRVAKTRGALTLSAYVNKTNLGALGFYEKTGFSPIWIFPDGDHLIWKALV